MVNGHYSLIDTPFSNRFDHHQCIIYHESGHDFYFIIISYSAHIAPIRHFIMNLIMLMS
jgi:hypothetical protein